MDMTRMLTDQKNNSPYRMLMSEMGMTRMPTSMSATASERRKKLVAFCSFFSSDTARITRMFPPIVRKMMMRMSSAGQFFSFIASRSTTPLAPGPTPSGPVGYCDRLASGSAQTAPVWFRRVMVEELPGHAAIQPATSREAVVDLNPPRRGPTPWGLPISRAGGGL